MQEIQRLTQTCHCGPGDNPKARGIQDYELEGESPRQQQGGCFYYTWRVAIGVLIAFACYVTASAFFPIPQPWERYFEFPGVSPTRDVHSVVADKTKDTGRSFSCTFGALKVVWSITQKAWCCRYENKGCPEDNNYDCENHQSSWQSWDLDKKYFCCGYDLEGCSGMVSDAKPPGMDCAYQLEDWESAWSPAKKKLCCEQHNFMCDSVPEVPQTCNHKCGIGEVDATCQERINWLVTHPKPDGLQGDPRACENAVSMVVQDCEVCSSCTPEDAGCL